MAGYRMMLAARQHPRVEHALARWRRLRGEPPVRSEEDWLASFVRPGVSFVDVGGMWGINGEIAIRAAELGASPVSLVDFYATTEFDEKCRLRAPSVHFVQGLIEDAATVASVGAVDLVWCWGVLYHHPHPGAILAALRMICRDRLLLESRTIPEVPGVPQAAVFWPYLPPHEASRWTQRKFAKVNQMGIDTPFEPGAGGGNNYWGMSRSAIIALALTYGFECVKVLRSPKRPQGHVFELRPIPISYLWGFGQIPDPVNSE